MQTSSPSRPQDSELFTEGLNRAMILQGVGMGNVKRGVSIFIFYGLQDDVEILVWDDVIDGELVEVRGVLDRILTSCRRNFPKIRIGIPIKFVKLINLQFDVPVHTVMILS